MADATGALAVRQRSLTGAAGGMIRLVKQSSGEETVMVSSLIRLVVLTTCALGGVGAIAAADEVRRSNRVPNVGSLVAGEQPLGDLWTFRCPQGGSVRVAVDTKDDTDDGGSAIDPVLVVFDGQGNVVGFGDDEDECSYRPLCGFRCPSVRADCGLRGRHSIVVRDFGVADRPEPACQKGGGVRAQPSRCSTPGGSRCPSGRSSSAADRARSAPCQHGCAMRAAPRPAPPSTTRLCPKPSNRTR